MVLAGDTCAAFYLIPEQLTWLAGLKRYCMVVYRGRKVLGLNVRVGSVAEVQEQPKVKRTGTFNEILELMVGVR